MPAPLAVDNREYDQYRRYTRARSRISVATQPYFNWLAQADILHAKVTITQDALGNVETHKSYPPEVERSMEEMTQLIHGIERSIYADEGVRITEAE